MTYLLALAIALIAAAATMSVTALVARAQGRVAIVDVAWGLGFVLVAAGAALVGQVTDEGDPGRRWLLVGLVTVWGLRLAWHIRGKSAGHGEDPRYVKLMGGTLAEVGMRVAVRKVFGIQGAAVWLVSAPVIVGALADVAWWPVVWIGVAIWVLGLVFEGVGDAQLAAYKRAPKEQRSPVMDRGLWRYTRHPELLRRRLRVVGAVAGRRPGIGVDPRAGHGGGTDGDDLLPGVRDRRSPVGAGDDEPPRLPRVRRPDLDVRAASAAQEVARGPTAHGTHPEAPPCPSTGAPRWLGGDPARRREPSRQPDGELGPAVGACG